MSELFRVVLQPEALDGIENAYRFIEAGSPESARKWIASIMEAIESLSNFPTRCPFAPENGLFDYEIRQLLYGKRNNVYRILFTIEDDAVHILHVRHGARQWLSPERAEE